MNNKQLTMDYVIYLSDKSKDEIGDNHLGYYRGECFYINSNIYPICDNELTNKTVKYPTKEYAKIVARKCMRRIDNVKQAIVKNINEIE